MSLAELETALVEFVGDALVNDCNRPVPDRVLRYHGTLPNDCCTDNGTLAISWSRLFLSSRFPSAATAPDDVCGGNMVAEVRLRYVVCWPVPEIDENGVVIIDDEWDTRAAMLADVADCVSRQLVGLSCEPLVGDPYVDGVLAATVASGKWLRLVDVEPLPPQGGCAGVQWRLYCGVKAGGAVS